MWRYQPPADDPALFPNPVEEWDRFAYARACTPMPCENHKCRQFVSQIDAAEEAGYIWCPDGGYKWMPGHKASALGPDGMLKKVDRVLYRCPHCAAFLTSIVNPYTRPTHMWMVLACVDQQKEWLAERGLPPETPLVFSMSKGGE